MTNSLPETQALQVMRADSAQVQQFANATSIDLVLMDTAVANLNLLTLLHTFPTAVLPVIDLTTDWLIVL